MKFEAIRRRVERSEQLVEGRALQTVGRAKALKTCWREGWTPARIILAGLAAGLSLQAATPTVNPASAAVLMNRRRPMPAVATFRSSFFWLMVNYLFRMGSGKTGRSPRRRRRRHGGYSKNADTKRRVIGLRRESGPAGVRRSRGRTFKQAQGTVHTDSAQRFATIGGVRNDLDDSSTGADELQRFWLDNRRSHGGTQVKGKPRQ